MPAVKTARPSLAAIRKWPPTVSVPTAAPALGKSPRALYRAIQSGRCPVATIEVNGRRHVLTWSLINVLEGRGDGQAAEPEP